MKSTFPPISTTIGHPADQTKLAYQFNGSTNYADGLANPFISQSSKTLIKFSINAPKLNADNAIAYGNNKKWLFNIGKESKSLYLAYESNSVLVYRGIQVDATKPIDGSVLINTDAKTATWVINGVTEVRTLYPADSRPNFCYVGYQGNKYFEGIVDVQFFDLGNSENDLKLELDKKLGALVDKGRPLGKNLRTNEEFELANEAEFTTVEAGKKWAVKTTGKSSYNKSYGARVVNFPCIEGKTYQYSVKTDRPVNLVVYDGNYQLVKPAEDTNAMVFTAKDSTLLYVCPRTDHQTTITDVQVREIFAWPIKQFSDDSVKEI